MADLLYYQGGGFSNSGWCQGFQIDSETCILFSLLPQTSATVMAEYMSYLKKDVGIVDKDGNPAGSGFRFGTQGSNFNDVGDREILLFDDMTKLTFYGRGTSGLVPDGKRVSISYWDSITVPNPDTHLTNPPTTGTGSFVDDWPSSGFTMIDSGCFAPGSSGASWQSNSVITDHSTKQCLSVMSLYSGSGGVVKATPAIYAYHVDDAGPTIVNDHWFYETLPMTDVSLTYPSVPFKYGGKWYSVIPGSDGNLYELEIAADLSSFTWSVNPDMGVGSKYAHQATRHFLEAQGHSRYDILYYLGRSRYRIGSYLATIDLSPTAGYYSAGTAFFPYPGEYTPVQFRGSSYTQNRYTSPSLVGPTNAVQSLYAYGTPQWYNTGYGFFYTRYCVHPWEYLPPQPTGDGSLKVTNYMYGV